jgi:beta-xylosidase
MKLILTQRNTIVLLVFAIVWGHQSDLHADGRSTLFANPILSGCYPDPSICRVNDNYSMVHSTFQKSA